MIERPVGDDCTTTKPITVLCVDDDEMVLDLLQLTIELEPGMQCVGALPTADKLISEVASKLPDIVIVDLNMPGRNPIEAIREISGRFFESRIIVHSGSAEPAIIDRLFEAGAWAYVTKGLTRAILLQTIREVASGQHHYLAA